MTNRKKIIEAVFIVFLFVGSVVLSPAGFTETVKEKNLIFTEDNSFEKQAALQLDRKYLLYEEGVQATLNEDTNDDCGYKRDVGDEISRSYAIYPNEPVDHWPGRGDTGKIGEDDEEDWYFFSVSNGQDIDITMTPPSGFDFDIGLWDDDENLEASSSNSGSSPESLTFTADYTGRFYYQILYVSGSGEGQYTFDVDIRVQNSYSATFESYVSILSENDIITFEVDTILEDNTDNLSTFEVDLCVEKSDNVTTFENDVITYVDKFLEMNNNDFIGFN